MAVVKKKSENYISSFLLFVALHFLGDKFFDWSEMSYPRRARTAVVGVVMLRLCYIIILTTNTRSILANNTFSDAFKTDMGGFAVRMLDSVNIDVATLIGWYLLTFLFD
jgi:hypothetical protein